MPIPEEAEWPKSPEEAWNLYSCTLWSLEQAA